MFIKNSLYDQTKFAKYIYAHFLTKNSIFWTSTQF